MAVTMKTLLKGDAVDTASDYIVKMNDNFRALANLLNLIETEFENIKASVTPGALNDLRQSLTNHVDNAGFDVWQRGIGPFENHGYCADRWKIVTGTISAERSTEKYITEYSMKTSGIGTIEQYFPPEFYSSLRNIQIKVGAWIKTNQANSARFGFYNGLITQYSAYCMGTDDWEWIDFETAIVDPLADAKIILQSALNAEVYWSGITLVKASPDSLIYVARLPALDVQECQSYFETGKIHVAGVGRITGQGREIETHVQFSTRKKSIPVVELDEETGDYDFEVFSESVDGFGVKIIERSGLSGTNGFVIEDLIWEASCEE